MIARSQFIFVFFIVLIFYFTGCFSYNGVAPAFLELSGRVYSWPTKHFSSLPSLSFTAWTRVPLQKPMPLVFQLIKKFPIESGASRTMFKTARRCQKPEPYDLIQTHPFIFSKTHFNIILPFTPGSYRFCVLIQKKSFMLLSSLTCLPYSPPITSFVHPNNTRWGVRVLKLLFVQFCPLSCSFLKLVLIYIPQLPICYTHVEVELFKLFPSSW